EPITTSGSALAHGDEICTDKPELEDRVLLLLPAADDLGVPHPRAGHAHDPAESPVRTATDAQRPEPDAHSHTGLGGGHPDGPVILGLAELRHRGARFSFRRA